LLCQGSQSCSHVGSVQICFAPSPVYARLVQQCDLHNTRPRVGSSWPEAGHACLFLSSYGAQQILLDRLFPSMFNRLVLPQYPPGNSWRVADTAPRDSLNPVIPSDPRLVITISDWATGRCRIVTSKVQAAHQFSVRLDSLTHPGDITWLH
jgi:hypothetical protein